MLMLIRESEEKLKNIGAKDHPHLVCCSFFVTFVERVLT